MNIKLINIFQCIVIWGCILVSILSYCFKLEAHKPYWSERKYYIKASFVKDTISYYWCVTDFSKDGDCITINRNEIITGVVEKSEYVFCENYMISTIGFVDAPENFWWEKE